MSPTYISATSKKLPNANFEKTMKERSTPSPIHLNNNDVVYEILTWLPAKSLMRFKSISKFWETKITRDSFFIQLHRRRSKTRPGGEKLLFHLGGNKFVVQRGFEHKFISTDKDGRNHITEYTHYYPYEHANVSVVDGLVCFYRERGSSFSASLHNLSTHESIALPEDSNFKRGSRARSFFFIGFDSSHTLYKILHKTDLIDQDFGETGFEVYTVGSPKHSWRIINSPPHECHCCYPYKSSVCINGVIYWFSWCCGGKNIYSRGLKIKAFDVSDEKFHLISIPHDCSVNCSVHNLKNVNGVPTLMDRNPCWPGSGYVINLWKLEDYKNQVWVVESILVNDDPKLLSWMPPFVVGSIGSGEILMIHFLREINSKALIYYDRAGRTSKVVKLDKPLPGDDDLGYRSFWNTYVENIMPLTSISNRLI